MPSPSPGNAMVAGLFRGLLDRAGKLLTPGALAFLTLPAYELLR